MRRDFRDHLVMLIVTSILVVATIYLFAYHSDLNYAAWGTLATAIISAYHWLNIKDDKEKDQ